MTAADRPVRSLADLAGEIRQAWVVARAAVPFPAEIEGVRGIMDAGMDDPRIIVVVDARHTAFEWALNELVDGDYAAPGWMIRELLGGSIPQPVPEVLEQAPRPS